MDSHRTRLLVAIAVLAISSAALLSVGCAKKAPQLTQAQLAAGKIGNPHPVSQDEAQKQGCKCHFPQAQQ